MLDARILSLIDRYDALAGELEQSVLQRVNAALDAAYRDLERQLRQTYPKLQSEGSLIAAQRKLLVMDELGSLLDLLQGPQADAYEQLLQDLINDADALGGDAAAAYLGAIDPTSPIANHAGIPLEAVALQARDGRQRLYRYSDEFRGNASAIVEQGLIQGWGTGRVQRLMRQQLGVTKSKAETLARTEMSRSLNNGALMRYQQSEVEYAQWVITPSEQLCRICAARNGYIYEVGKVEIPAHPRCLPPGVIVSSTSVKAGTSRQYRGEIITIKTASGKELTATPNHPVLTDQGWIGLGSLNEGSHVFSCVDSERVTHSIDPNKYTRPTLIEKVVASLRESSSVASRRVKVTPKDFHGDGGDSDVCVVSADRLLWNTSDAYFSQPFKHLHLKRRLVDTGRLLAQRLGALLFPANLSAPTGFVSLRCLGFLLGWRHLTNSQPVSLGGIAGVDTSFQKNSSDENATQFPRQRISNRFFRLSIGVASNYLRRVLTPLCGFGRQHSFLRNLPRLSFAASQSAFFKSLPKLSVIDTPELSSVLNRFSSEISLDRVIKLSVSHYSGPVYNLETSTGWYFANNILTHNCRCFWLPVSKDWIDKGLIDAEFIADYRQQGLDLLKQNGQTPDSGPTYWEKKAGATAAPKPVWKPKAPQRSQQPSIPEAYNGTPTPVLIRENSIRTQKFESAALYDSTGQEIFFKDGQQYAVSFNWGEVSQMADGVLTHNHPRGWGFDPSEAQSKGNSFSPEDLDLAVTGNLAEIRAVAPGWRHSMKRPAAGWPSSQQLQSDIDSAQQEVKDYFMGPIVEAQKAGDDAAVKIMVDYAQAEHWHEVSLRVAQRIGADYTREPYAETPWSEG